MSSRNVRFTSLGSVREIGASAHFIEIDGVGLLLDCGLHPKKDGLAALPAFRYMHGVPDAVLISHGHHDHCAALPYFVKKYPGAIPYATPPTVRIMDRMLHNGVSVMEKIRQEQGIIEYPLYDHDDVDAVMRKTYGIQLGQEFGVLPNSPVRVSFSHAGHVLGSASVRIRTPDHTLFYTSDICTVDQELMSKFTLPSDADSITTLIIESTYGANEDADRYDYQTEVNRFAEGLRTVLNRRGVVLVPSFALGRTQEILNVLNRLQGAGQIPDVPIYASGLGRAIYEIYDRFSEQMKPGVQITPLSEFRSVGDVYDPQILGKLLKEPSIIVATSGMMIENTPSSVIAERLVQDERNAIFFVGYCDPDTLGFRVKYAKRGDKLIFTLGGEPIEIKLDTIEWYRFSAHAHRKQLLDVINQISAKNIIFVHGDAPAVQWMHEHCPNGYYRYSPEIGQTLELED